jgi:hypothetical protein
MDTIQVCSQEVHLTQKVQVLNRLTVTKQSGNERLGCNVTWQEVASQSAKELWRSAMRAQRLMFPIAYASTLPMHGEFPTCARPTM